MSQLQRVFIAHRKDADDARLASLETSIRGFMVQRVAGKFDVRVITGRDSFNIDAPTHAGWKGWTRWVGAGMRPDGSKSFDVIVVPDLRIGAGTRAILKSAAEAGRAVRYWNAPGNATVKVASIRVVDARDWQNGWALELAPVEVKFREEKIESTANDAELAAQQQIIYDSFNELYRDMKQRDQKAVALLDAMRAQDERGRPKRTIVEPRERRVSCRVKGCEKTVTASLILCKTHRMTMEAAGGSVATLLISAQTAWDNEDYETWRSCADTAARLINDALFLQPRVDQAPIEAQRFTNIFGADDDDGELR